MIRQAGLAATLLAVILVGSGCDIELTSAEFRVRELELVSVGGQPLPATLVNIPDLLVVVLADTLRFDGEGRWDRTRVLRTTGITGMPEDTTVEGGGAAVVEDGRIELIPACPAAQGCFPGETLTRYGSDFRSRWAIAPDSVVTVRYRVLERF